MVLSRHNAFTIIEVMAAIFLITTGILGVYALAQRVIAFSSLSTDRLTAAYLVQEGIEVTRNIRDTNWLEQRTIPATLWDDGLDAGDWEADYTTIALMQVYADTNLNIDGQGFYGYTAGTATKFKRKITIGSIVDPNRRDITVEVSWTERGRTHQFSAQENLYNWR